MKKIGKYTLLEPKEFSTWLKQKKMLRKITLIQQHHTYIPSYKDFTGNNHFELCYEMEKKQIEEVLHK